MENEGLRMLLFLLICAVLYAGFCLTIITLENKIGK